MPSTWLCTHACGYACDFTFQLGTSIAHYAHTLYPPVVIPPRVSAYPYRRTLAAYTAVAPVGRVAWLARLQALDPALPLQHSECATPLGLYLRYVLRSLCHASQFLDCRFGLVAAQLQRSRQKIPGQL